MDETEGRSQGRRRTAGIGPTDVTHRQGKEDRVVAAHENSLPGCSEQHHRHADAGKSIYSRSFECGSASPLASGSQVLATLLASKCAATPGVHETVPICFRKLLKGRGRESK